MRSPQTEEPRPVREVCREAGCDRSASRSDGMCARHSAVRLTLEETGRRAAEQIVRDQHKYARLHLTAAERAAEHGDARPAQWALVHGGTLKPVERPQHEGPSGIVVNVGIALPGLPPQR